ncbi:hypothetical protein QUB56_15240 [Microcoleus sp. AR_TQ3_B6]|uniref:hypothetical protein n=1 Tax=Microcoleus sp. AR_TQ3_B6 TaxID=3055284 RepID=UPI002FD49FE3
MRPAFVSGDRPIIPKFSNATKSLFTHHYQIGISLYPQAGMIVDTLLKKADIALYRVKGSGRNTYSFYTATIPSPESNTQAIENPLNCAGKANACCIISLSSICKQVALRLLKFSQDGILLN